jgi:hypothetical protein
MGYGIPVKHQDTIKTAEQNSQTGDQRTMVRAQPGTPHWPPDANNKGGNHTVQLQL